ncbi:unnamed protein product [Urochloa humidicola]
MPWPEPRDVIRCAAVCRHWRRVVAGVDAACLPASLLRPHPPLDLRALEQESIGGAFLGLGGGGHGGGVEAADARCHGAPLALLSPSPTIASPSSSSGALPVRSSGGGAR